MRDRLLIRHIHHEIKRGGGGPGYLYNLRSGVDSMPQWLLDNGVQFDIQSLQGPPVPKTPLLRRVKGKLARMLTAADSKPPPKLTFAERFGRALQWWTVDSPYGALTRLDAEKLFECDLLFVHQVLVAERLVKLAPELARRKLVLITHSPTFISHEFASDADPWADETVLYAEPIVRSLLQRELEVMRSVRAMAWPCEEAKEAYLQYCPTAVNGTINVLVETGVAQPGVNRDARAQKAEWGISPEQRVALFMGRPHPHKGFDRFLAWADENAKRPDRKWVFVYAGAEPKADRDLSSLKRVGYVSDNGSAYAAADLVLVPNRYSYFDIGALEMLSLGAREALSPTGGHKHLLQVCPDLAVIPSGDAESTWEALEAAADRYAKDGDASRRLRDAWEQRFSLPAFVKNHVAAAKEIVGRS
jgi:glycosyltransferase involved in cell wall biosynthesis